MLMTPEQCSVMFEDMFFVAIARHLNTADTALELVVTVNMLRDLVEPKPETKPRVTLLVHMPNLITCLVTSSVEDSLHIETLEAHQHQTLPLSQLGWPLGLGLVTGRIHCHLGALTLQ